MHVNDSVKVAVLGVVTAGAVWFTLSGSGSGTDVVASGSGTPVRSDSAASAPASASPSAAPATTPSVPAATPSGPVATPGSPAPGRDPATVPDKDVADSGLPVVPAGNGQLTVVPGSTPPSGPGQVQRYSVSVEGGLGVDAAQFGREVDATLADPRSWGHTGKIAFQRVDSGPVDVKVVLASPATTDRMCRPLSTNGIYSCGNGPVAVINEMRWLRGADAYTGHLATYRQYVINHEVGHTIGHGHAQCPAPGQLAPVMMQQTIGIGKCVASPWPFP